MGVLLLWCALAAQDADEMAQCLEALKSEHETQRRDAAVTLRKFKGAPLTVVPALRAVLADPSPAVRAGAAESLGAFGSAAAGAVDDLAKLFADPERGVREAAMRAAGLIGPDAEAAVPGLVDKLDDAELRWVAVEALGHIGAPSARAVPRIIAIFAAEGAPSPGGTPAPDALATIGSPASRTLVDSLTHASPQVRELAELALARMGAPAVVPVARALKSRETGPRPALVRILGAIGERSPDVVEPLVDALQDPDAGIRMTAAAGLARAGEPAVSPLRKLLKGSNAELRALAAQTLGVMGPKARAAIPDLESALAGDPALADSAAQSLGAMGEPGIEALGRGLRKGAPDNRRRILRVLAGLGERAHPAKAAILNALKDEDPLVRVGACGALGGLGPRGHDTVQALARMLRDKDVSVQGAGAAAIRSLGPAAKEIVPDLARGLRAGDANVRKDLIGILGSLGKDAAEAAADLAALVAQPAFPYRVEAARALVSIGTAAAAAVPTLQKALEDKNPDVRKAAEDALRAITGSPTGK
jgi:HEAT repeat protein